MSPKQSPSDCSDRSRRLCLGQTEMHYAPHESLPAEVAISSPRAPWVAEIERRLRENDVKVKRFASLQKRTDQIEGGSIEYDEATARLVLYLDGHAPNTQLTRCYAGGYNFSTITAELVDVQTNETLGHFSNSGYFEGCFPLSGTIFEDITGMVLAATAAPT